MSATAGTPWPGAARGEVVSPTGRRAYLVAQAAELADRSTRWAADLARAGKAIESERGHIVGRQGAEAWFLIADSFEKHLGKLNRWPPKDTAPSTDWEQLFLLQGADLEAARRQIAELTEKLEHLQAERNELLDTIIRLSQIAKTPTRPA
ncbi:Uncharacterised protein [Mycobacteroides abscessus subsp. bolletii]|uniref:hypothetical protein n=1 Tax=Mycobacteroides abscessus TaxID=36809 RepID=UPI0009A735B1|nr:hypothetical protein [Mycobacteroides abscessus]SKS75067.1 Uncharacterised protein [Mycobacteroides abscessus subsp. bolletii]SKS81853.1 Uncharacterised protein [Mycobacteroides abscessus subsp. bolletii]